MLTPTDNTSFFAAFEEVFNRDTRSKLLEIERDIQEDPHIIHHKRKAECLMMAFIFLSLHKQNIEREQYWQQEAAKAAKNRPEPRLDSRIVAEQLGVEHRATLSLVTRHQADLEQFGSLAFEMRVRDRQGIPTRFALLNENQCYFLAALSRNTAQVVRFKVWLVKTFSEYRTGERKEMPSMPRLSS